MNDFLIGSILLLLIYYVIIFWWFPESAAIIIDLTVEKWELIQTYRSD